MEFIDSHCHLHDSEFYDEDLRTAAYEQTVAAGVTMICVGTDARSSQEAVKFAENHAKVWAAVGIHPHDAENAKISEIRDLLERGSSKIVGIGEIGLDYYYDNSPRQAQRQALREQLTLAQEYGLAVSFHVRDEKSGDGVVWQDFWKIFDEFDKISGVLHSFTDSEANLQEGLRRGLCIGVNGISTFTKNAAQQKMFQQIPLEKMLLETDAPFLTPAPLRGKMNIPMYVRQVAEFHAQQRGIPIDKIAKITADNARKVFGIDE